MPTAPSAPPQAARRIASIDLLRGLIMALMALDHARFFLMGFEPDPMDLEATTPALFATRWITHLCAPGFLLLAGLSVHLQAARRGPADLAGRLLARGAVLILLEWTVVTFAWIPDPTRGVLLLQVIWAIGWSLIAMAGLVFLGPRIAGLAGLGLMALHPEISGLAHDLGLPGWLRTLLLDANGSVALSEGQRLIVSYPTLPWTGVMAAGYGLGALLFRPGRAWEGRAWEGRAWQGRAAALGAALILGFAALRAGGIWGDPVAWQPGQDPARSVMAFLDCEKYPPSPLYLMMTLGPLLVLLAAFARLREVPLLRMLQPFGQAALFFYILHLYALRAVGLVLAALVWGAGQLGPPPLHSTPEWPLWSVWAIWAAAMPLLFLPTRRFARYKRRRGGWTSYF